MRWASGCFAVLLALVWLLLHLKYGKRYNRLNSIPMEGLRLRKFGGPVLLLLEKGGMGGRIPGFLIRIQRSLQRKYGIRYSGERTLLFMGEMFSYTWLLLLLGSLLTALSGELSGLLLGGLLGIVLPVALIHDLHRKVQLREQRMMFELPELLNSIVLLVGAGETVQRAIIRCANSRKNSSEHPLYAELSVLIRDWESGDSFQQAFENFSKRCSVQEVSLFTTAVLLNHRRGGADFALALRDLSRLLWEKRKAISRTQGEQASSKLVFPMVVIFLIVIVLVGAPAMMMLNM